MSIEASLQANRCDLYFVKEDESSHTNCVRWVIPYENNWDSVEHTVHVRAELITFGDRCVCLKTRFLVHTVLLFTAMVQVL